MAGIPIDPEIKHKAVTLEYWTLTVIVGGAMLFALIAGLSHL